MDGELWVRQGVFHALAKDHHYACVGLRRQEGNVYLQWVLVIEKHAPGCVHVSWWKEVMV